MEDTKGTVGLSVSPSDLIVVSYFFGPILAGLANRHLLPGGKLALYCIISYNNFAKQRQYNHVRNHQTHHLFN